MIEKTTKKLTVTQKVAATAGAFAAMTTAHANADIVYVDNSPLTASAFDGQGIAFDWDVDGAGGAEFQAFIRSSFFSSGFYFSSNSFSYNFNFYGIVNFNSTGRYGTNLNGGGLVGPGGAGANALNQGFVVGPTLNNYQWGNTGVSYRSAVRADSFSNRTPFNSTFGSLTNVGVNFCKLRRRFKFSRLSF